MRKTKNNNVYSNRGIDSGGRVVIPKEFRDKLDISEGDKVEIYIKNGRIILKKFFYSCEFCGDIKDVTAYRDYYICEDCVNDLSERANCS
ncbi:MAG TPA: AbrB/MazE/SpoVT family DNA-binding domain-containing protein [Firmicutes bacterium]|nr:AbrB/MazE/SpoVT family DNA-binding domain-containing protein [Bacillota bacterium]